MKFAGIKNPRSARHDVHAFLLLDSLVEVTSPQKMVMAAEHDLIYLETDCAALAEVITDAQVQELRRCGVVYDESLNCLEIFV